MAPEQFEAGVPVVVPTPFALKGIDAGRIRSPAAVVLNGGLESTPVTSGHIADHAIDVEQQQAAKS